MGSTLGLTSIPKLREVIVARVYRSRLVYRLEEVVSDPRVARPIAGGFIAPRRRFRIVDRAGHSSRDSKRAGLSPRGGGFGS